jgi:hypothetical protein
MPTADVDLRVSIGLGLPPSLMFVPGPPEPTVGCGRGMRADLGRISRRAHDDIPSGVALFEVGDCCGDFCEPIAPVDVGVHFAGLNQVRK